MSVNAGFTEGLRSSLSHLFKVFKKARKKNKNGLITKTKNRFGMAHNGKYNLAKAIDMGPKLLKYSTIT